ncbi:uncharacterized protein METZ01_LOCUS66714 [marine metagenome]|uniref:Uncharacterized protein n=1 Tax=marine metagenome TaxID=408172 RepID=A0A381TCL2_9ZZZZ
MKPYVKLHNYSTYRMLIENYDTGSIGTPSPTNYLVGFCIFLFSSF